MNLRACFIFLLLIFALSSAAVTAPHGPLTAAQAFKLTNVTVNPNNTLSLHWNVAPDHYLYQPRFRFNIEGNNQVTLGSPTFPSTIHYKKFPTGENMKSHTGKFIITLPLLHTVKINTPITLKINYQGCSELGLCYPEGTLLESIDISELKPSAAAIPNAPPEQDKLVTLLQTKGLLVIMAAFFGIGILLSLTPCVLPMIPILSGIIVGQKKITHTHSFLLAFTYVFAMAVTYAALGIIIGLVGAHLQTMLQALGLRKEIKLR